MKPIIVNIATHKARLPFCKVAVKSLVNNNTKPDQINIYVNDCDPPKWMEKYNAIHGEDLGASAKFASGDKFRDCIYLTCDDDLLYPPGYIGYISDMAANKYKGSIVGFHATIFEKEVRTYYHGNNIKYFSAALSGDVQVDMLGTGTMAFDTSAFSRWPDTATWANMCDPNFSVFCKQNNVKQYALTRSANWILEQPNSQDSAIWKTLHRDESKQLAIIKSAFA